MKRPLKRHQSTVFACIADGNNMIGSEGNFIYRSDDLAAISQQAEHSWLNGAVEDGVNKLSQRLLWVCIRYVLGYELGV